MGECDRFQEGTRLRAICEGKANMSPRKVNWHRVELWGLDPLPEDQVEYDGPPQAKRLLPRESRPARKPLTWNNRPLHHKGGPGTELKQIISRMQTLLPWFDLKPHKGCGCTETAKWMDKLGPDGCEVEIDTIVKRLEKEAKRRHLTVPFQRYWAIRMVKRAIAKARSKQPQLPYKMESSQWITTTQLTEDAMRLVPILKAKGVDAVVGIARSGLLPASIVAVAMHVPMYSVGMSEVVPCGGGWRTSGQESRPPTKIAIIDDTVFRGVAMKRSLAVVSETFPDAKVITSAVYCESRMCRRIDACVVNLPRPHHLEWNFFNSIFVHNAAFDMDGILCEDIDPQDDDDGERYDMALRNARPKYLVRREPIPAIVTARLERWRPQTEEWLRCHGIMYHQLIMGHWNNLTERYQPGEISRFKAEHYKRLKLKLFVESCPIQAKEIRELSGKPVLCPQSGRVI